MMDSSIHSIGEDVKGNAIGDVLIICAMSSVTFLHMHQEESSCSGSTSPLL